MRARTRQGRARARVALAVALAAGPIAGLAGCADVSAAIRPATFEPRPTEPDPRPPSHDPADPLAGFAAPMWMHTPRALTLEHSEQRLVTWSLAGDPDVGVRLMAPTIVRAPRTAPAPSDLHAHLLGLRRLGVRITRDREVEIDGVRAHRFTLRTQRSVRDGLGCWSARAEDCFSLVPGPTLEMTTFAVRGRPVVLWSRTWGSEPDSAVAEAYGRALASVSFERWGRSGRHRSHLPPDMREGAPSSRTEPLLRQ